MRVVLSWPLPSIGLVYRDTASVITVAADLPGPLYQHSVTLIPAWISNYMPGKLWGEITYPSLNFNGRTVEG